MDAIHDNDPGGMHSAVEVFARDGLEFLDAMRRGEVTPSPFFQTLGLSLIEIERGRAVFEGVPDRHLYNPIGTVHSGFITSLLDSALVAAIHSTLAAGEGCLPVEIKANMVRPLLESTGRVRAEGAVLYRGRTVATAEGKLIDTAGKLYAHATVTCTIFMLNKQAES